MKRKLQNLILVIGVALLIESCNQNEELKPAAQQAENQSEISLMEKELGITFFKEELKLADASGRNNAVMIVAAKDQTVLRNYLKAVTFTIRPVHRNDFVGTKANLEPAPSSEEIKINTDGIYIEFASTDLENDVIGLSTSVRIKDRALNGRVAAAGFPNQVTFTSGTWAEIFKCFAYQSVHYKFEAKTNRFSGWSTRQFCNYNVPSICLVDWEQPGGSLQQTNVDGPYRIRAVVDYFVITDFTWEFLDF